MDACSKVKDQPEAKTSRARMREVYANFANSREWQNSPGLALLESYPMSFVKIREIRVSLSFLFIRV